jgi:hypothetical protein
MTVQNIEWHDYHHYLDTFRLKWHERFESLPERFCCFHLVVPSNARPGYQVPSDL